ncbi:cytidylyltransferase domain-containing protein, partial [Leptospira interrogans]
MKKILGVIPARYASSRFPGKPLAKIGDKTMIEWTYRNASR